MITMTGRTSDTNRADPRGLASLCSGMGVHSVTSPYRHVRMYPILEPALAQRALSWLCRTGAWARQAGAFFRHDTFALTPEVVPPGIEEIVSPNTLGPLRALLQSRFGAEVQPFAHVEAHRSTARDDIGLHTDADVSEIRLMLNLNARWAPGQGGVLQLQDRPGGPACRRVGYRPLHNSATAFRTAPDSYHRVSPMQEGERYTLLYRFPIQPKDESRGDRAPLREHIVSGRAVTMPEKLTGAGAAATFGTDRRTGAWSCD